MDLELLRKRWMFLKETQTNSNKDLDKIIWHVKPRNLIFTGRQSILEHMENELELKSCERTTLKFVLNGMGGVGKSWIVNEFLYRNREKFKNIFWFDCEKIDDFHNQIQEFVGTFQGEDFPKNSSQDLAQKRMKYWFEQSSNWPWILVFDNLETYETIQNLIPQFAGILFVTSRINREENWPEFNKITIGGFEKSEMYEFMKKIFNYCNTFEFDRLIKELGNLPLAISNACYLIDYKRMTTISEYLKPKMTKEKILEILHSSSFGKKSIWNCIQISLDKIKKECPLTYEYLQVISLISGGNDLVPKTILDNFIHLKNLGEMEKCEINRVILKYDLFKEESVQEYCSTKIEFCSIHRLVHSILKFSVKNFQVLKISSEIMFTVFKQPCVEKQLILRNNGHGVFLNSMIEFGYKMEKSQEIAQLLDIIKIICKYSSDILTLHGCKNSKFAQILQIFFGMMEKYVEDPFELCSPFGYIMCSIGFYWDSQFYLGFFEKCLRMRKDRLGKNSASFENFYIFFQEHFDFEWAILMNRDGFINICQEISNRVIAICGENDVQLISIYCTLGTLYGNFFTFEMLFNDMEKLTKTLDFLEKASNSRDYFRKASTLIKNHNLRNSIETEKMFKFIENIICHPNNSRSVLDTEDYKYIEILTELVGSEDDEKMKIFIQNVKTVLSSRKPVSVFREKLPSHNLPSCFQLP